MPGKVLTKLRPIHTNNSKAAYLIRGDGPLDTARRSVWAFGAWTIDSPNRPGPEARRAVAGETRDGIASRISVSAPRPTHSARYSCGTCLLPSNGCSSRPLPQAAPGQQREQSRPQRIRSKSLECQRGGAAVGAGVMRGGGLFDEQC
jgi:hypothetical protein